MALFHSKRSHDHPHAEPESTSTEQSLGDADYDAEVDLASPAAGHHNRPGDLVAPFAGMVVPDEVEPGYDIDRDTAP